MLSTALVLSTAFVLITALTLSTRATALAVSGSRLCKAEELNRYPKAIQTALSKALRCTLSRNAYKGHTMY